MTGMSPEVREQQVKDDFRNKLTRTIAETEATIRQNTFLLEMVREMVGYLPTESSNEALPALELAEYDVKEKTMRLDFLLETQKKHYPMDYESYERNRRH